MQFNLIIIILGVVYAFIMFIRFILAEIQSEEVELEAFELEHGESLRLKPILQIAKKRGRPKKNKI